MATVLQWTGLEAKALRAALRLNMQDFSHRLGVNQRSVAKWEARGRGIQLKADTQAMLDTALRQAPAEAQERFELEMDRWSAQAPAGGPSLLPLPRADAGVAVRPDRLVIPHLGVDQLHEVSLTLEQARGHPERELTRYFEQRLLACQAQDGSRGPHRALPVGLSVIAAVDDCARRTSFPVRQQLLGLAARTAELVAWLYRDAGADELVTYWCDRAMEWAQEAGDGPTQSYVLLKRSQFAWDSRNSMRVLAFAQAAQAGPWELPARIRAEITQQEARGQAMVGGDTRAIERMLGDSHQLLADAHGPEEAESRDRNLSRHYKPAVLHIQTAICYGAMGDAVRAVTAFDEALSSHALSRRDRGFFTAVMTNSLVAAGEPDEAAQRGLEVHHIAVETGSVRTLRELRRLDMALRPWADRQTVSAFQEVMRMP